MIQTVHVIVITDAEGNECSAPCGEMSDTIQLHGIDSNTTRQSFESDAYHASAWADNHGFKYTQHDVKLDVDTHEVDDWQQHGYVKGAACEISTHSVECGCGGKEA